MCPIHVATELKSVVFFMKYARQEIWFFDTDEGYLGDIWGPDLFCLMPPPPISQRAGNEETETDFHLHFSFWLSLQNSSRILTEKIKFQHFHCGLIRLKIMALVEAEARTHKFCSEFIFSLAYLLDDTSI